MRRTTVMAARRFGAPHGTLRFASSTALSALLWSAALLVLEGDAFAVTPPPTASPQQRNLTTCSLPARGGKQQAGEDVTTLPHGKQAKSFFSASPSSSSLPSLSSLWVPPPMSASRVIPTHSSSSSSSDPRGPAHLEQPAVSPAGPSSPALFYGSASPTALTSAPLLPFSTPTSKRESRGRHGALWRRRLSAAGTSTTGGARGGARRVAKSSKQTAASGGSRGDLAGGTGWPPLGFGWARSLASFVLGANSSAAAGTAVDSLFQHSWASSSSWSRWSSSPGKKPPASFGGGSGALFPAFALAKLGGIITFAAAQAPGGGESEKPASDEPKLLVPENAAFYRRLGLMPLLNAKPFPLPELPWPHDALSPSLSGEAIEYHFGKHHAAYAKKVNEMAAKDPSLASKSLKELIATAPNGPLLNNAAQLYNHTIFWRSMKPNGGGPPEGEVKQLIEESFGSFEKFKEQFTKAAIGHFGSGWIWLVVTPMGKLRIMEGHDARGPIRPNGDTSEDTPVLTLDVWEHAYYIDFRNARAAYVERWFEVVNWDFANHNLEKWRMEKNLTRPRRLVATSTGKTGAEDF